MHARDDGPISFSQSCPHSPTTTALGPRAACLGGSRLLPRAGTGADARGATGVGEDRQRKLPPCGLPKSAGWPAGDCAQPLLSRLAASDAVSADGSSVDIDDTDDNDDACTSARAVPQPRVNRGRRASSGPGRGGWPRRKHTHCVSYDGR